jgi:putative ABC transport system permease protein
MTTLRHATRHVRANPGFAAAAIATIAIGIGATAAMFSVVNAVLLRPLPFADPDRLVAVETARHDAPDVLRGVSLPELHDWRSGTHSYSALAGWRDWGMSRHDVADPEAVYGVIVTPAIFTVLPLQPRLGRLFNAEDDVPGRNQVVLLTEPYWRTRFAADPGVVGKTLSLERGPRATYTVIGVLPPAFTEMPSFADVQIVALSSIDPDAGLGREVRNRRVVGRLRPGVSVEDAQNEMHLLAVRLGREFPDTNAPWDIFVRPLRAAEVGPIAGALRMLFGAVGFVLLSACANVAGLQLARALGRRREFAIRQAIGATRAGLMRVLLREAFVLCILGTAAGVVLAGWLVDVMLATGPTIPRAEALHVDMPVLLFAIACCGAAALFVALPASLLATRMDTARGLREDAGQTPNRRAHRWRLAFVGAQLALSVVLLTGAVRAAQSFAALLNAQPGFDAAGLAIVSIVNPTDRKSAAVVAAYSRLLQDIRGLPGVRSASAVSAGPLFGGVETTEIHPPGAQVSAAGPARYFNVAPGYFATIGVSLRAGRDFGPDDQAGGPAVVIVNEAFARRYLAAQEAVGSRLTLGQDGDSVTVVGVAADFLQELTTGAKAEPQIYFPYSQHPRWAAYIVVRADDPGVAIAAVRNRVRQLDPAMRPGTPRTMDSLMQGVSRAPRFTLLLLSGFALTALLLSGIGVYGLVSYATAQRTREIGVRLSLGATRGDIVRLLTRTGVATIAAGGAAGAAGAVVLDRFAAASVIGVAPLGAAALLSASALLIVIGGVALYLPVHRALRLDPISSLRV